MRWFRNSRSLSWASRSMSPCVYEGISRVLQPRTSDSAHPSSSLPCQWGEWASGRAAVPQKALTAALWSYASWLTFLCFSFCTCEMGLMILLPAKVVRKNKELTHMQCSEQGQSRKPSIRMSCSGDIRHFLLCTQHRWCAHPRSGLTQLIQSKTGSRNHLRFPWAEIFLPKAYPVGWCCLLWTQSSQEETKTMLANKSG